MIPIYPLCPEGFHKNPGSYPDKLPPSTKLIVQWGNGHIDKERTYTPSQLRWSLTGDDWDVYAVKLVD